jgi:hypothetical protein
MIFIDSSPAWNGLVPSWLIVIDINIQAKYTRSKLGVNSGEFRFRVAGETEPDATNPVKPVSFNFLIINLSNNENNQ